MLRKVTLKYLVIVNTKSKYSSNTFKKILSTKFSKLRSSEVFLSPRLILVLIH